MMRFLTMILLSVALPFKGSIAQPTDVSKSQITWTSPGSIDLKTGAEFTKEIKFISYAADRIEVPGRSVTQVFDIVSVDGSWTDLSQPGKLTYQVTMHDEHGVIILEKNADGLYITIDMSIASPDGIKRKFSISQVIVN